MNKIPGLALVGLVVVFYGGFSLFPSVEDVSARSLSASAKQLAGSPEQPAELETVTFDVPSMTCASCPFIVTKTLQGVPGVKEADADFETKTARAVFDKDKTNVTALLNALKNSGYPSSVRDGSLNYGEVK